MRICVIGTGYVGLVTGTVFADLGNDVFCVDKDAAKIDKLNNSVMPFFEPGLKEMVERNVQRKRLTFTTDIKTSIQRSEIVFICVNTPAKNNGETDLSFVEDAALDIAKVLDGYKIVVNKSTVPVETGDLVRKIITENQSVNADFDVVSNPEFLREGTAIHDMLEPSRIVIGVSNRRAAQKMTELYARFRSKIMITDVKSAEIIKYASNAFLACKISFINMLADLCEKTGADVREVSKGMGSDHRIGPEFLAAGIGYGGSCFPKDVSSLEKTSEKFHVSPGLLQEVSRVNRERVSHHLARIRKTCNGFKDKVVAVLGLAFKANTDDMREAKSIEFVENLLESGAIVHVYDPQAMETAAKILGERVRYFDNYYEAVRGARVLLVLTEWREFEQLDMQKIKEGMQKEPILFDGRNIYKPEKIKALGFKYIGVGM
jgi:UDPglucose 6-dehydrogenase